MLSRMNIGWNKLRGDCCLHGAKEEEPFWVVQREEIKLAEEEEELGRGGWTVVKVATCRGT